MAKRDNAPQRRQTAKKLTSNQQEWKKQIQNLKGRIRKLENQGAIVDFKIPEMPKRIDKSAIENIKNIRRRDLVRGVEYRPVGSKKEIKYKPAQQINDEGKLEKWKPPERGKAKEREAEVRAKRKAIDVATGDNKKSLIPPEIPNIPVIPKPEYEPPPEHKIPEEEWDDEEQADEEWDDELRSDDISDWDNDYDDSDELILADAQIDNLKGFIDGLGDEGLAERLNNAIDNLIESHGKSAVADNIEANLEKIAEYAILAAKYKGTSKGNGFVNMIAQLIAGDRILSFGELAALEKANDYNDDFSKPV